MNTFVDRLCLLNTELRFEPFRWLAILFGIIAAAISVTKRNDIAWDRTWAIIAGEGYPMVGGDSMPKTLRTPTGGTATVEVSKSELPVGIGKVDRKRGTPGGAALPNDLTLLGIITLPTQRAIQDDIAPPLIVQAACYLFGLRVAGGIGAAILLGSFALLIHLDLVLYSVAVSEIVLARILNIALGIGLSPFSLLSVVTGFALRAKAIFACAVTREILRGSRVIVGAIGAMLKHIHSFNYSIFEAA